MLFAISFLFIHWYASLFFQSFYLHRYSSHRMFKLTPIWNRIFCLMTIVTQGPSFLRPALYRHLHLRHHLHSDSEQDPHSPMHNKNIFQMMNRTLHEYLSARSLKEEFPGMIRFFDSFFIRFSFVGVYILLYLKFTDSLWYLLLVPIHSLMGPIHGAIVNWFGHKSGYRNFETDDHSKNTLIFDFLMLGELYQNNHHAYPNRSNFSIKRWEFDLTHAVMVPFKKLGIII